MNGELPIKSPVSGLRKGAPAGSVRKPNSAKEGGPLSPEESRGLLFAFIGLMGALRAIQGRCRIMLSRTYSLAVALAAVLGSTTTAADPPAGPAYQIVLRSRTAEVTPNRSKGAQTGGGSIVVEQVDPNTITVTMGGSAVVGSECHGSNACMDFHLEQDLEIVALRNDARPPRMGMVARVVGTLQVTDPGCLGSKSCGAADQGPATACLALGNQPLLSVNVQPSNVCCGQESAINNRQGPVECQGVAGCYRLNASFRLGATQGKGIWHRQMAVADFDPAPQLDAFWSDVLKPFRAVPRRDFGYKLILRVVEDAAAPEAAGAK